MGALVSCSAPAPLEPGVEPPPRDPVLPATPLPEAGPRTDAGGSRDASTDAPAEADARVGLRVFVTSTTQNARFGGLAGGDTICANVATAAGLGGAWVAWLSKQNGPHAVDRLTSDGPWHLVTGERVAANKLALTSGTLERAIDRDEKGAQVPANTHVWTGTGPNGRYLTNDCDAWTPGGNSGRHGNVSSSLGNWTSDGTDDCGSLRPLYCFEK